MCSKRLVQKFTILALGVFLFGCTEPQLFIKEEVVSPQSKGEFCLANPLRTDSYTKFLFVVDKTGSNNSTDNGGVKRASNIRKFIQSKIGEPRVHWGLVGFSSNDSKPYIKDGDSAVFIDDEQKAINAVDKMQSDSDNGSTPYRAGINAARVAISTDQQKNPDQTNNYMVFFISDGEPTDVKDQGELNSLVEDVVDAGSSVIFSTAFYGGNGSKASQRLSEMAKVGGGKFVNFEKSQEWNFSDLIPPPRVQSWFLKKFLVYNVNAGYCIDGSVDVDSDADGMCDKDEIEHGFDPQNRFTMGDGFGDFFHWRSIAYNEILPNCTDRSDVDRDLLTACEESYIENLSPPEGVPRNGDPENPDTDRDGIIDGIETFVYFTSTLAYAMDNKNLSRSQFDAEEDAETQIDQHRNPLVKDPDAEAYDTQLEKGEYQGRDCFNFSQTVLPIHTTLEVKEGNTLDWLHHKKNENKVLVYYIQTLKSDPDNNGVYQYSYQTLEHKSIAPYLGPSLGLKVRDGIFDTYIVP